MRSRSSPARLPSLNEILQERARRATSAGVHDTLEQSRERCQTLHGFVREAWHVLHPTIPFEDNWHIRLVCDHLEAISRGRLLAVGLSNRIRFNMPAGTLKSVIVSVLWQAWEWGPFGRPDLQYLSTTYTEAYAIRDARKTRDLVESDWYQARWGSVVRMVNRGEAFFSNDARGFRQAMPFGSLTSGRGDRLLIDDPHSVDTVESDADLERTIRRFREVVPDRINDPRTSAIVVVMHRLSEKDICADIERRKLPYVAVVLPMEFEPERACVTPIGRDPRVKNGELLMPARWTQAVVDRDKNAMSTHAWNAQKQQRPTGRVGAIFQRSWFPIEKAAPAAVKRVRAWDLAATRKKPNTVPSATVGVRMSVDAQGIFWVEHVERFFETADAVEKAIINLAKSDGGLTKIRLPQDPGQAGKAQAEYLARKLAGYTLIIKTVSGAKETRWEPLASQAKAGNVRLVEGPWNDSFLDEICACPNGQFDDQPDAAADAFIELATGSTYTLAYVS